MRGFVTDTEVLFLPDLCLLLLLIRDTTFTIRLAWDVVYSSRVEAKQLLYLRVKILVPKFFELIQKIRLGTLDEVNLTRPEVTDVDSLVFSQRICLAFLNYFDLILRNEIDGSLDKPFLAGLIILISTLVKVRYTCTKQKSLFLMNDHDVADSVAHDLPRLEEELALASANFLFAELWLSLLVKWVINDTVLILLQNNDTDLFDQLLLGIDYVDIFHRFIDEPLLSGQSLLAVEISEILKGSNVQGCLVIENEAFPDINDLNLSIWHEKSCFSVQPLI